MIELKPGRRYGYRAKKVDPLDEVELLRLGVEDKKKPRSRRAFIQWIDDKFEGREKWVPAIRLIAPWADAQELMAREQRWAALRRSGGIGRDDAESTAAGIAMDILDLHDWMDVGVNEDSGTAILTDPDALANFLDVDAEFLDDTNGFIEDGKRVVGWSVVEQVIRRAVERNPDPIMRDVEERYAQRRLHTLREGIVDYNAEEGRYVRIPRNPWIEEQFRATEDVLKQWCGAPAQGREDDIQELLGEVQRLTGLAHQMIAALRSARRLAIADKFERQIAPEHPGL